MIYFIQAGKNGPIKIGHTNGDVKERLQQLQNGCPYELILLWCIKGTPEDEAYLHKKFKPEQIRGEWFRPCRQLLEYIEVGASNVWQIRTENKNLIEIEEFKNKISTDSSGWHIEENKKKSELFLCIDSYYDCNIDFSVGGEGCYRIDVNKNGIKIQDVDIKSPFGNLNILLEGDKIIIKEVE